jgi:hypothetical protein
VRGRIIALRIAALRSTVIQPMLIVTPHLEVDSYADKQSGVSARRVYRGNFKR